MYKSSQKSVQPTEIDPWLDGGPLYADDSPATIAPVHGWDNAVDVAEAKRHCRDEQGAARATKKDASVIFDVAHRIRTYGVSERVAVGLISTVMQPPDPFNRGEIESIVSDVYSTAVNVPGLLSQAGRPENAWVGVE